MVKDMYTLCGCTVDEIVVLKLIQSVFGKYDLLAEDCKGADWYKVFEELCRQSVAALPIETVGNMSYAIPKDLLEKWRCYVIRTIARFEQGLIWQDELYKLFESEEYKIAILKGTATAKYYPDPFLRNVGDIDFLVARKHYMDAYELLKSNGYELVGTIDEEKHHISMYRKGANVEIHKEPNGISQKFYGDIIRKMYDNFENYTVTQSIGGHRFYCLDKKLNGLVLLLHIASHIDSGLGLRQLCDWMVYVEAELDDKYWYAEFQPLLHDIGLEKLAVISTGVCKHFLGLSKDITWCDGADRKLCADLMRFVLDGGLFGRKKERPEKSNDFLGRSKGNQGKFFLINVISNLQKRGVELMELDGRKIHVSHMAWTYPITRYARKILKGKKKFSDMVSVIREVEKNKRLRNRLEIYK